MDTSPTRQRGLTFFLAGAAGWCSESLRLLGRRAGGARFEEAAEPLMVAQRGEIGVGAGPVPAVAPSERFLQQAQCLIDGLFHRGCIGKLLRGPGRDAGRG